MKFMASRINYPLLFMLIKIKVKKRDVFLIHNLELSLEPFTLKQKVIS
jgi:hypothetical protein